jgi:hypothetical protein
MFKQARILKKEMANLDKQIAKTTDNVDLIASKRIWPPSSKR